MQNQKRKPVQLEEDYHAALRSLSGLIRKEMGRICEEALLKNPEFAKILKEVKKL